ncbi:MAG: NAD(+) synthase [Faecalibacterium sp.]|jgi:NAD+ synthase (glutamine-hydrolysing)|nr:NAD(+) synthase [Faecalibacterium sp.]
MQYGFIRAAALSPALRVADCRYNALQIVQAMQQAEAQGIQLAVFPELCLTGYTCGDLFLQRTLQQGAEQGLRTLLQASAALNLVAVAGLPVRHNGKLYNCAAVVCRGALLGLVPKTFLPNYAEFYEKRHFSAGRPQVEWIDFGGQRVPFGTSLLFCCRTMESFVLGVEICEDVWAPLPPSTHHALAGATVIANLSASDETVGKAEYRRSLVAQQSARLLCAYLYADAGHGESTTDMVFAAHDLIAENGTVLAEAKPFQGGPAVTELDLERMLAERVRNTSFVPEDAGYERVYFDLAPVAVPLTRAVSTTPFVPGDAAARAARCELILEMQADGLAKRLEHAHAKTAVIGISGGLDSCLALLVAVRAMRILHRASTDILAVTMPCFGTTKRTRSNAEILCGELAVTFQEIEIGNTVKSHFDDIGLPESDRSITYENGQARVRTLELMDVANRTGGIVVGTGDLSELALGWATYNGDHMSMYGVNAGVPKTLVRHIVRYEADTAHSETLRRVLLDILDTPVSPELLPAEANGEIAQKTESLIGPYELHDFYLYYVLRFGFGPGKIFHLARAAFAGQPEYTDAVLLHWLENFYRRFFMQQFKRSCLPDGPKIGSVTLSPRGDWRMPSDARNDLWAAELEGLKAALSAQNAAKSVRAADPAHAASLPQSGVARAEESGRDTFAEDAPHEEK